MLKRKIELKRNLFLVQLLDFFPIAVVAGILSLKFHHYSDDMARIMFCLVFIFSNIICLVTRKYNQRFVEFSEDKILVCRYTNKAPKVLQEINVTDVSKILFNEKAKKILVELKTGKVITLLKYPFNCFLATEVFFKLRAEMFRYYPQILGVETDEYVEKYLSTGYVPEYIQELHKSGKSQVIITLLFEFIFAIIPIALMLLSVMWGVLELLILVLKSIVYILNLFI